MTEPQTAEVMDLVEHVRARFAELFACRCDPAWTERKLHAPDCLLDLAADAVEVVASWVAAREAEDEAFIAQQVDEARLLGWHMDSGHTDVEISMALESAAALVQTAKTFLAANPGAKNYVEQSVIDRETGDRYTVTIQRPGGQTPHELRRQAEAETCAVRDAATAMAQFIRARHHTSESRVLLESLAYAIDDDGGEPA